VSGIDELDPSVSTAAAPVALGGLYHEDPTRERPPLLLPPVAYPSQHVKG